MPRRGCAAAVERRSRPSPPTTFANGWIGRRERWVCRAPYTRCCGFEASETLPFPGADSIFSSLCGAISGRLHFAVRRSLAAIPASEAASVRPACGTGSRKTEIPSAFCEFSRLCKAENFPLSRGANPPILRDGGRPQTTISPIVPTPRRSFASPHAGERAPSPGAPPRSERCRCFPYAVSATREVNRGSMQRP